MIRALPRVALAGLFVAVTVSGCAFGPVIVQPSDTPSESPEAAPASAIDDRCDGLISTADYEGLWEGDLEPLGYFSYGAATTETMSATALVQSEALICSWNDAGGTPAVLMFVMRGGEEGFRRTEATFADPSGPYTAVSLLDGAYVACRGGDIVACHWNVLHGSDWISVLVEGGTPEQVLNDDLTSTAPAHLVAALAEAVTPLDIPTTPAATPPVDCNTVLSPGVLVEPLGVDAGRIAIAPSPSLEEATLEQSSPEFGQVMWKYAEILLGYSACGVLIDDHLVGVAMIAPDSAWVLHDPSAQQPELQQIGGYGDGIHECAPAGSTTICTAAVASGDDLLFTEFQVPEGIDGAAITLAVIALLSA
jgi:hypothetical protein